jgi:outer membrane protein insertion porin family
MAAPRAPAFLLSLIVSSGLLPAAAVRAQQTDEDVDAPVVEAPAADDPEAAAAAAVAFPDQRFGPRYVIDEIVVRGNHKTEKSIIIAEAAALGLVQGAAVDASDPRVEAVRYRLLALGYFLDVRLSVTRGASRGGVVLVVEVEERGTIVINELFPSTSAATAFWGGADVSETNFLGRGINVGGGFVASTTPSVPGAHAGLGLRLRAVVPPIGGPYGLSLSATGLYNDGSEFYRLPGAPADDPDPRNYVATRVKRAGGVVGVGKDFRTHLHLGLDFREEAVKAELPAGPATLPINYMIMEGSSRVGSGRVSLDLDTRSDPILPRSGMRLGVSLETASSIFGSSYTFVKGIFEGSFYRPMPRGHALGFHLFMGGIAGDAPYFDRYFIGDLNLLLPRRALGINFSTLPSRNLLDTSIAHHRYDQYAARALVEYAIPVWRRRGFVYGGDAFVAVGLLGVGSPGDFIPAGASGWQALPIDLTADLGIRLDTYIGIFTVSIANALTRTSF